MGIMGMVRSRPLAIGLGVLLAIVAAVFAYTYIDQAMVISDMEMGAEQARRNNRASVALANALIQTRDCSAVMEGIASDPSGLIVQERASGFGFEGFEVDCQSGEVVIVRLS